MVVSLADRLNEHDPPRSVRRAAQYVRMSTEHQQYSTENQAKVIQSYAVQRGFEIVRTYAVPGRGLLAVARECGPVKPHAPGAETVAWLQF